MKTINLPLFWKFAFTIITLVFIFGTINMYILWKSVYQSFEKEIDKRCVVLSDIISQKALTPIVYDDVVSLYNILDELQRSDKSIAYIFLTDNNRNVLAKTFDSGVPASLLQANTIRSQQYNIEVLNIKNYKYKTIRDIAYPILNGDIGMVRLGLVEDTIRSEIIDATKTLVLMILLFLAVGLSGAFAFSYLITSPIKIINQQAQLVKLDSINPGILEIKYPRYKRLFRLYFRDELDILVARFREMLIRLNQNYSELQKTRDSFVQAEKMAAIGTLVAGIGHEINNPISGIKNCAIRIAKKPENTEQTLKYIALIKGATDKMENVTRHLLDFSRTQETEFTQLNPASILDNSISLISFKAQKAKIVINKDYDKGITITGNPNQLEQVILNFLINSLDAISEKSIDNAGFQGEINVILRKNDSHILMQVQDNGSGIPLKIRRKLFDPFYTTKEAGKGTGLGLYVSFNIIKEHKGKIYFDSKEGEGSTFSIELNEGKGDQA
ncbi:MAG: HAMP domain-containing histidine kinase [Chlorobi bacterium]|nr:HAMP domain-containing histidine kinase [Chlorobiota bacterium]